MNSKMTTNNYQQMNLKTKTKNKLSKQLEQEQNQRNGDHMEDIRKLEEGGEWGKGTGNKKHNSRYKTDRRR